MTTILMFKAMRQCLYNPSCFILTDISTGLVYPAHDKTYNMTCAKSEHSDQPVHLPNLIRVFTVRIKKAGVSSYPMNAQRRLRSHCTDAQVDLSIR